MACWSGSISVCQIARRLLKKLQLDATLAWKVVVLLVYVLVYCLSHDFGMDVAIESV